MANLKTKNPHVSPTSYLAIEIRKPSFWTICTGTGKTVRELETPPWPPLWPGTRDTIPGTGSPFGRQTHHSGNTKPEPGNWKPSSAESWKHPGNQKFSREPKTPKTRHGNQKHLSGNQKPGAPYGTSMAHWFCSCTLDCIHLAVSHTPNFTLRRITLQTTGFLSTKWCQARTLRQPPGRELGNCMYGGCLVLCSKHHVAKSAPEIWDSEAFCRYITDGIFAFQHRDTIVTLWHCSQTQTAFGSDRPA